MSEIIAGVRVPDSAIARAATQLVRDTEDDLLYNHSRRVFFWGALTGQRRGLKYDPELLYLGAMFQDMGLTEAYSSPDLRFEVDGANAAREFMKGHGVSERDIEDVWTAIALHTTPGIPEHMRPTIALVTAGVEMDVLGIAYHDFTAEQRHAVCDHQMRGSSPRMTDCWKAKRPRDQSAAVRFRCRPGQSVGSVDQRLVLQDAHQ